MDELQTLLASHGLLIVAFAVLIDQLGVPIPAPPVLVLAGSMVGAGELSPAATLLAGTAAAVPSDGLWFAIGRRRGRDVLKLLCRISLEPDSCVRNTGEAFERRGVATLLFAKFVPGLQTIAPPLAGASGMAWTRFLAFDVVGALVWVGSFLALGALLQDQIDGVIAAFGDVGLSFAGAAVAALLVYLGWKAIRRQQFIRALRVARIEPDALHAMIEAGERPAIYDLRNRGQQDGDALPGAIVIGMDELDARHEEIPRDRDIILYCT